MKTQTKQSSDMKYTDNQLFNELVKSFPTDFTPSPDQKKYLIDPIIDACELYLNEPESYEGKIHIISSPTGSGKTTVLTQHILFEMQKYYSGVIISAPTRDLVFNLLDVIDKTKFQVIELTSKSIDHYIEKLDYRKKMPVFVVTQQFFCLENNREKFLQLANTMYEIDSSKLGLAVFVDEVHRGAGNSSEENILMNYGYQGSTWTGAIFNTLTSLVETECAYVFGYTATPTTEQQLDEESGSFLLLSAFKREKEKSPFVRPFYIHGLTKNLKIENKKDASNYVRNIISDPLKIFRKDSQVRDDYEMPQVKMMIKLPQRRPGQATSPIDLVRRELGIYANDTNWNDLVIASFTGTEAFIDDNYVSKEDFVREINSIRDKSVIYLVVNGLNCGTDIPETSHVIVLNTPNQKEPDGIYRDGYVTMTTEQTIGRCMRTGIPDVREIIQSLYENYVKSDLVSEEQAKRIIQMISILLTKKVFVADSSYFEQVTTKIQQETFNEQNGLKWLISEFDKLKKADDSKIVSLNQERKPRHRLKTVFDQTASLKPYKKKECAVHGIGCFELSFNSYVQRHPDFPITREEYRNSEMWDAQLHVDHIDGNRYNNDPSNYQTLCALADAEKTLLNGDCYNNYTLRQS